MIKGWEAVAHILTLEDDRDRIEEHKELTALLPDGPQVTITHMLSLRRGTLRRSRVEWEVEFHDCTDTFIEAWINRVLLDRRMFLVNASKAAGFRLSWGPLRRYDTVYRTRRFSLTDEV